MADLKPLETNNLQAKFAWERPERKDQAGSLIIFGGVSLKLKEVDTVFKASRDNGVGSVYALVPESLARVFKRDDPYLVPVNFDGYFGLTDQGIKTLQNEFSLADGLILADIGKSSSTEHKLAVQIARSFKPVIVTDSAISLLLNYHAELLTNPHITLILNLQNLQKLIKTSALKLDSAILSTSTLKSKLDLLAQFQTQIEAKIILTDEGRIIAVDSKKFISLVQDRTSLELASRLACWQIWSPKSYILEQAFIANADI